MVPNPLDRPDAARTAFPEGSPELEVVIVTFRSASAIGDCLRSIERFVNPVVATVTHVVDNDSDDGTADLVATNFPWVQLHRRKDNAGFAIANNGVLRDVRAPWVLVLNPDTEVDEGVIEHLLAVVDVDRHVGVASCRLVQRDGTFDHASKRTFPSPLDALRYFVGQGRSSYLAPDVDEFGHGFVDAVNGAFMLVRTSAMREVGLLDESFWMYGEDLDWCKRFGDAGWKVLYDGRVTAVHLKGASSGKRRSLRLNWQFHRSMIIFYRKHQSGASRVVDLFVYLGIFAKFVVSAAINSVHRGGK